jgi:hypothetical protein
VNGAASRSELLGAYGTGGAHISRRKFDQEVSQALLQGPWDPWGSSAGC